ncbi:ALK and LTK ligand 2 isoform X2 [Pleurodeles waltl]|uniref:ALK and LTK ligand 2 isoform X2 n=1 Tax=Pleurodeles waltl TaxID=8319 RepID=UPI0037095039
MSQPRGPLLLALLLCVLTAGCCKERTEPVELRDSAVLNLIMDIIQDLRNYHLAKENGVQFYSKFTEYNLDDKEAPEYGHYQDEQRVEIVPRDLRMKDKFLKHLTGPLYFSPKCSKHFHRLYHTTRDCTIPASHQRKCRGCVCRIQTFCCAFRLQKMCEASHPVGSKSYVHGRMTQLWYHHHGILIWTFQIFADGIRIPTREVPWKQQGNRVIRL